MYRSTEHMKTEPGLALSIRFGIVLSSYVARPDSLIRMDYLLRFFLAGALAPLNVLTRSTAKIPNNRQPRIAGTI